MKNVIFALALLAVSAPAFAEKYNLPYVGDMEKMHTKYEDTFVHIAYDNNLGYVEMRAANPYIDPWVPGSNKEIILPKRHILPDAPREGLVINLPEQRLYFFPKDGSKPVTFPIGSGREGLNTPTGKTTIVRKTEGPVWRPTPRMRQENPELPVSVGPGPENPLGTHALYLGWPEYLVHGTNRPFGIGRRVSSGCIRLYPQDIIDLYNMVPVGAKVTVVDQPIKLAWIEDRLYIEAHPDLEQSLAMEEMGEVGVSKLTEADLQRITKYAGENADRIRWAAVRTAVRERRGYPVEIARRGGLNETAEAPLHGSTEEMNAKDQKAETLNEQARLKQVQAEALERAKAEQAEIDQAAAAKAAAEEAALKANAERAAQESKEAAKAESDVLKDVPAAEEDETAGLASEEVVQQDEGRVRNYKTLNN